MGRILEEEKVLKDSYWHPLPKMVRVRQKFSAPHVPDLKSAIICQLRRPEIAETMTKGQRIAVLVGSRGISRIDEIVATLLKELKGRGTLPFVVPAMGSHGGATNEGQVEVLASLGVTEERMGVPVVSSMEPIKVGEFPSGAPVYFDRNAFTADGIVAVNRVKPHTAFRGEHESGLIKMITIGAGKHLGAKTLHAFGSDRFGTVLVDAFRLICSHVPVKFGVAVVENAYDQPALIEAVPVGHIEKREADLLKEARALMPRIMFDSFDVLIVEQIGKNISGDGMDPNITHRYAVPNIPSRPSYQRLVVLGLTPETRGNAIGVGMADVITRRLVSHIDYDQMYINALASKVVLNLVKVPMTLESDHLAIAVALESCVRVVPGQERVVRIKTTLDLGEIQISETLLPEAAVNDNIEILSEPEPMRFDAEGRLL